MAVHEKERYLYFDRDPNKCKCRRFTLKDYSPGDPYWNKLWPIAFSPNRSGPGAIFAYIGHNPECKFWTEVPPDLIDKPKLFPVKDVLAVRRDVSRQSRRR